MSALLSRMRLRWFVFDGHGIHLFRMRGQRSVSDGVNLFILFPGTFLRFLRF